MNTLSKKIKIGDVIECVTEDGLETGTVVRIDEIQNVATVLMEYTGEEAEFTAELIRG